MSTILYIKASPLGGLSYSIAVADAFIESYRRSHPDDEIKIIDIFQQKLPEFDLLAATAKYKIMHTEEHTKKDRQIWQQIVSVIEEFKSADKFVFAVPMWNFSIPYRLKQYIDISETEDVIDTSSSLACLSILSKSLYSCNLLKSITSSVSPIFPTALLVSSSMFGFTSQMATTSAP